MSIFTPPFMADSWAQMPTIVQLAASRRRACGGCSPSTAIEEVVDQVRVAAAVAAALQERQVVGVLDRRRLREPRIGSGSRWRSPAP